MKYVGTSTSRLAYGGCVQDLPADGVRESARGVAVRRVDVAGDAEERNPRLAPARHGEVVVADGVVAAQAASGSTAAARHDGDAAERRRPAATREERDEHAGEQRDLRGGPGQGEERDADADR